MASPPVFTFTADTNAITINFSSYGSVGGSPSDGFKIYIYINGVLKVALLQSNISNPWILLWSYIVNNSQGILQTGPNNGDTVSLRINNATLGVTSNIQSTIVGDSVACFTSNSRLLTSSGYKAALDIQTGDLLMTADGRAVPVQAFTTSIVCNKETAPYLIPKHSLGHNVPALDLRLSPWHAIQLKKGLWMKPATAAELGKGVQQYGVGDTIVYYHFEAPNYFTDNFICDGTVVESFANKQLANSKTRVYRYNSTLEAYTRAAKTLLNRAT